MAVRFSRRTALIAAGAAALALPGTTARTRSHKPLSVKFVLNATTLDGGEQVTSVTLDTSVLGPIDPATLTPSTFTVHAKSTIPLGVLDQTSAYDLDRSVTAARLDPQGNIVLSLSYAEGQPGGNTLAWVAGRGRNFRFALDYTITHRTPLTLHGGRQVTITRFAQGDLVNAEVDAFTYHVSGSGMKYRLYSPAPTAGTGKRPLIVWLHGGGEGGSQSDNYYDNETPLRANRGALGFTTDEAQQIFGDAYVVAPQSTSFWMEDGDRFAPLIHDIVQDVVRTSSVDPHRIYVTGCSNGGYMTMKLTTVYPDMFAAAVPICGVVESQFPGAPPLIPDTELAAVGTPTWLVASRDDTTVNPQANTIHAHDLIPGSLMTLYDHVLWNGNLFQGHFSWIYVARNDPSLNGTRIWQWMAQQHR